MSFAINLAIGALVSLYVFLHALLISTQDAKEPPAIITSFPFFGPLIGMIRGKALYYVTLRNKYKLPLYTLRLPFSRIYVLNSPQLIPPIQKQWRALSFAPFTAVTGKGLGMSKQSVKIMHQGLTEDHGYNSSWVRRVTPVLAPGKDLDSINRRSIEIFAENLKALAADGKTQVDFWKWTRQLIVDATSESIYGPQNPFRDPQIKEAWK
ncbi:hypothetical protein F5Y16DRAFT_403955 [Xylariaceae sp. FL0255]|nr:hypothetical protein F5Y16DRAFT_403955 [Xylariaceae sp. FL0255]